MDADGQGQNFRLQRRGTVNLVKNFMVSKIQRAQASGFVDNSSMGEHSQFDSSRLGGGGAHRSRTNNFGHGLGGIEQRSALNIGGGGLGGDGSLNPGNINGRGNRNQMFYSQMNASGAGNLGNDKTGAPVNFVMQPEAADDTNAQDFVKVEGSPSKRD